MFTDFTELKILDLGNNEITRLTDKTFASMTLLKSVKLNNNTLMSIDDAVFSDLKLRRLDLSCNQLTSDNFLWSPSIKIEYLNLTYNEYKLINASVLENIIVDFWGEICRYCSGQGNGRMGGLFLNDVQERSQMTSSHFRKRPFTSPLKA